MAQRALLRAQGREAEAAEAQADALTITVHRRYNPAGVSQYNVVPGLLGVILQMTMVMMTSIGLTRELERGTMENLLAMPANGLEIMLGKVLPYFVVGAVQVVVILGASRLLFHVPFVGSMTLLLTAILAFVMALVSDTSTNNEQRRQRTTTTTTGGDGGDDDDDDDDDGGGGDGGNDDDDESGGGGGGRGRRRRSSGGGGDGT